MRKGKVIAIDGPVGAGKSTVAAAVARRLGFMHVDTGALYRCLAVKAAAGGVGFDDGPGLAKLAAGLEAHFETVEDGPPRVFMGGREVTAEIRAPKVSDAASRVSSKPEVRAAIVDLQRGFAREKNIVMEGRDIGTVIFPDAEVKIFLTADLKTRTERRAKDLEAAGIKADRAGLAKEIEERDRRDATRKTAPLKKAEDAVEVDTTGMSFKQTVDRLVDTAKRKMKTEG
jgi:CMP/dCMP kinase